MIQEKNTKLLSIFALCTILLLYGFFLAREVNLVTADIGRHIINGREILQGNREVLSTNFYSYTEPEFSVINHHWLSGILFYLAWNWFGFGGLHLFFIVLSLLTLGTLFWFTLKRAGPGFTAVSFLITMPLIVERIEIRPEVFSYFFAALFFVLLARFLEGRYSKKSILIILVLLQIAWVNTHILFFLGPALMGAFLIDRIFRKDWDKVKTLTQVQIFTIIASFINPFGIKGAFAIFYTLKEYGYRLVENQPVWFIENLISNPNFANFKIIFLLLIVVLAGTFTKRQARPHIYRILIAVGISAMAWVAIRNFTLFGLFAGALLALEAQHLWGVSPNLNRRLVSSASVIAFFVIIGGLAPLFPARGSFGVGLGEQNTKPIEFITKQKIEGPIFNNYDIGGYLIFHLFPQERVFVDNRPEAYSVSFFKDLYIPMQEQEELWQEQLGWWRFNVIIFSHRDATPWGQNFLISRVNDPDWSPIYVDSRVIIFVRNQAQNAHIIEKFKIPREMFQITGDQ